MKIKPTDTQAGKTPKFDLEVYRQFIRDAAPYVSLVVGRKIHPADADLMTEEQITSLAIIIDQRVNSLDQSNVTPPKK